MPSLTKSIGVESSCIKCMCVSFKLRKSTNSRLVPPSVYYFFRSSTMGSPIVLWVLIGLFKSSVQDMPTRAADYKVSNQPSTTYQGRRSNQFTRKSK